MRPRRHLFRRSPCAVTQRASPPTQRSINTCNVCVCVCVCVCVAILTTERWRQSSALQFCFSPPAAIFAPHFRGCCLATDNAAIPHTASSLVMNVRPRRSYTRARPHTHTHTHTHIHPHTHTAAQRTYFYWKQDLDSWWEVAEKKM